MAAIKDVAKLAGVSVAAVSKYLKTPNNMREDTRQRIAQAIEELNYRPNPFAQSLRTGKTNIIAIAIPEAFRACPATPARSCPAKRTAPT